jgi:hypothetical protein
MTDATPINANQDQNLLTHLALEDRAEGAGLLAGDDRMTCHLHRRWLHHCVASPTHVNATTRHRWCQDCERPLTVVLDELNRTVTMTCPDCGDGHSPATARMLAACRASLLAEDDYRRPMLADVA